MRLILLISALALAACGTAPPVDLSDTSPAGMSEANRGGTAVDLLRGRYPSLRIDESGGSVRLQIRQRSHPPVVIVDGFRTPVGFDGQLDGLPAADIVEIEVLKTLADTMVYGDEAALGGVIKVTTRLGRKSSP